MMVSEEDFEGKDRDIFNYLMKRKSYDYISKEVKVSKSRIKDVKDQIMSGNIDSSEKSTDSTAGSTITKSRPAQERQEPSNRRMVDGDSTDSTKNGTDDSTIEIPSISIKELVRSTLSRCKNDKWPSLKSHAEIVGEWLGKLKNKEVQNN